MSDDDRITVPVRLTPQQHELLRRRSIADQLTIQTVLSAGVNAYVLGDLKVRANGRYFVSAPNAPLSRDDTVTVRAPNPGEPDRTVTIEQAPATQRRKGSEWLREHIERRTGRSVSPRMLRRLLAHLEDEGRVEPREGRYWKFDGEDDSDVVAVRIAMDDGTYDDLANARLDRFIN